MPSRTGEGFSAQNAGEGQEIHVHPQKTKAWHEATLGYKQHPSIMPLALKVETSIITGKLSYSSVDPKRHPTCHKRQRSTPLWLPCHKNTLPSSPRRKKRKKKFERCQAPKWTGHQCGPQGWGQNLRCAATLQSHKQVIKQANLQNGLL